ncbi:MAG: D-glucuronyl C5-epimerase family protein, partial [Candidatus Rokuibacteriota bacterium]
RGPPPRTLASDLASLRVALTPHARTLAAAAILVLTAAVAAVLLRGGGSEPELAREQPPAAPAGPGNQTEAASLEQPAQLLREGQRGADVRDLQHALASLGYYGAAADGAYGEGTAAAVTSFQAANGLLADGIVGATTTAALREAIAARAEIDAGSAEEGLEAAVAAGRLEDEAAARHRQTLADAQDALAELPPGRGAFVATVLRSVAIHADAYDGPRAHTLFEMLDANVSRFRARVLPATLRDFVATDGIVYLFYTGHGFQFNPLTNFSRLNGLARKGRRVQTAELAEALVARGIPVGNALAWEYYFPFGGPSRWTSGFSQAVGAQALARAGELLDDPDLIASARAAYRLIPRDLSLDLPYGAWIQEYGYSDMPILNAQLQSIVSLSNYVEITGDERARAFTENMAASARSLLHRFDTGCWSRYSLDGSPADTHYHAYHVDLLGRLSRILDDPTWGETQRRWAAYEAAGGC